MPAASSQTKCHEDHRKIAHLAARATRWLPVFAAHRATLLMPRPPAAAARSASRRGWWWRVQAQRRADGSNESLRGRSVQVERMPHLQPDEEAVLVDIADRRPEAAR